jgi:hypothetical protein
MRRRSYLPASLAAAMFIFSTTSEAQIGVTPDQVAQCEYEAALYAEGRIVMTHRIKVPIAAGFAALFAAGPVGVAVAAAMAANAESPLERRAVTQYRNWCLGLGPAPRGM